MSTFSDLYIVASRVEGGPQSIMECSLANVPIISTDVGIASQVLSKESIYNFNRYNNPLPNIDTAYKNSKKFNNSKHSDSVPLNFGLFNHSSNSQYFSITKFSF